MIRKHLLKGFTTGDESLKEALNQQISGNKTNISGLTSYVAEYKGVTSSTIIKSKIAFISSPDQIYIIWASFPDYRYVELVPEFELIKDSFQVKEKK